LVQYNAIKTVFGENALLLWEKENVFVEKHVFRGDIISVELFCKLA
jgi:hypothetical protein